MSDVLQKMEPLENVREKDLKSDRQRPKTLILHVHIPKENLAKPILFRI